jgi:hypothetical protein
VSKAATVIAKAAEQQSQRDVGHSWLEAGAEVSADRHPVNTRPLGSAELAR